VVPPFHDHPAYLDLRAELARPWLRDPEPDRVVLSFHGLPERQVRKSDASGRHCLVRPDCCAELSAANRSCYRAHCLATARALAARLGLDPARTRVGFQSRLGRMPWLRPYLEEILAEEPGRGARDALIVPSFVADCLETLEELALRGAESWRRHGGRTLRVVPAPNADDRFVAALAAIAVEGSSFLAAAARPAEAGARSAP
jgi:ferrochelatase